MELTVFAKKRITKEGKTFYNYLSVLTKKDGTDQPISVKFRDECGSPKPEKCPMNIVVEKAAANISKRQFIREDTGEKCPAYTLWISAWKEGAPYVDHSLDDYNF